LKVILKNIKELIPYEKNPRKNDEAVKYVKESIKEFGFKVPMVIDSENVIVAGHTRYKAAKQLKLKEVPCVIADDLTEEQIKAYRLADNKVSEFAEWDYNLLNLELDELINFNMNIYGFEIEGIDDEFGTDFELPNEDKPQTRTITLSLAEEQYQIAFSCIDYITDNNLIKNTYGNANKKSNALFEVIYQWAEQKTLL
jgi:site-specific DNA-methyltransferase (adenine-specific)